MNARFCILSVLSSLLLVSCGAGGHSARSVELTVNGAGGRVAIFDRFENNRPVVVDSVELDATGRGRIDLPALPLDFYRIRIGDEQLVLITDSTEQLQVQGEAGSFAMPSRIEGSFHTALLHRFQKDDAVYVSKRDSLRSLISTDPTNADAIDRLNALNSAQYQATKALIEENSTSPVALSAINKLNMQQEFALFKKVRDDLRKPMGRSGYYTAFREQVDRVEQQEVARRLQEEEMQRLAGLLPIGGIAPDIRQQTPSGGTMALSELRGKVVLIDFWASWCRPCRMENPAMKRVYDKYKGKGFEIFGVSLDRDHNAWVNAIKADGIDWKHVSDLGFWNNAAAQEYGVSSIPFTVLLDREGKVMAKGLRSHDLEQKLAEIL